MTPEQKQAHDWLMSQADLITDCRVDGLLTKRGCEARRKKWRNHQFTENDEQEITLTAPFGSCEGCKHFKPIRIPKRKQRPGLVGAGLNPGQQFKRREKDEHDDDVG